MSTTLRFTKNVITDTYTSVEDEKFDTYTVKPSNGYFLALRNITPLGLYETPASAIKACQLDANPVEAPAPEQPTNFVPIKQGVPFPEAFADHLRQIKKKRNLTIDQFAWKIHKSRRTVFRLLSGRMENITIGTANEILSHFGHEVAFSYKIKERGKVT